MRSADLDVLADRIAARLARRAEPSRLLAVAEVAAFLVVGEDWVRENAPRLGGLRLSPGGPWRFAWATVIEGLTPRYAGAGSGELLDASETGREAPNETAGAANALDKLPASEVERSPYPKKAARRRTNAPGPTTGGRRQPHQQPSPAPPEWMRRALKPPPWEAT